MGIKVTVESLAMIDKEYTGYSGCAYIDELANEMVILVDSGENVTRRRYLAAHELGHHILYHTKSGRRFLDALKQQDVPYQHNTLEVEANRFASELLMPASRVEAAFRTSHSISDLSQYFGVSEVAMLYRFKSLGLVR